jgi:hypothetical protein
MYEVVTLLSMVELVVSFETAAIPCTGDQAVCVC